MMLARIGCVIALAFNLVDPAAAQAPASVVRRLTVEEAVRLSLENNLGIRVARIDPQIQDLSVAQAARRLVPDTDEHAAGRRHGLSEQQLSLGRRHEDER